MQTAVAVIKKFCISWIVVSDIAVLAAIAGAAAAGAAAAIIAAAAAVLTCRRLGL